MSTERIGKNGQVVGTAAYFEELNTNSMFKWIFTDPKDHHYWDQLSGFADRVISALEEMHQDLKNNAQVLGYFSSDLLNETADFVQGLSGICSFMKKSTSEADACLSFLELQDYSTRPKSGADKKEIFKAVAEIQKEGNMWQSDVIRLLEKARDYGLGYLSGDEDKLSFIKGLYGEESRDFYDDVLCLLQYQNRPDHFKGKCNSTLCSKEYIFYFQRKTGIADISMHDLPKGGTYEYAENIKYALNNIYDIISDDLFANGQYLSVESINKLKLVSDDMTKLISKGFDDKFKSALTDVVNVDGLVLDQDYFVLSEDDLALVKALSNESLYYEQERNEPVMKALAYEVVKIRQKAIYYDQYNRGPYLNKEGYEQNNVYLMAHIISAGEIGSNAEYDPITTYIIEKAKLLMAPVAEALDVLSLLVSFEGQERVKYVLETGDIEIEVIDYDMDNHRTSYYKRDGTFVVSSLWAKKNDYTANPDIKPISKTEIGLDYLKSKVLTDEFNLALDLAMENVLEVH